MYKFLRSLKAPAPKTLLRTYSNHQQSGPSLSFRKLAQRADFLNKIPVSTVTEDYHYFFPDYYTFSSLLKPTHMEETRQRIKWLKHEYAQQLKLDPGKITLETLQELVKPGIFYKINPASHPHSLLMEASEEEVARAEVLLGMPIYAHAGSINEIPPVLDAYRKLLKVGTIQELDRLIAGGSVIYVIQHQRALEELRTLLYLEHTYFDNETTLNPEVFGYEDVYQKFIHPKIFGAENANPIITPEKFSVKAITSSYSSRIFDISLILTKVLKNKSIDPEPFLSNVYGLNLIANPYNYVPSWYSSDWRKPVLKTPRIDTICNAADIATRVLPKVDLLYTRFQVADDNHISIKESHRQAIFIVPDISKNVSQFADGNGKLSTFQIMLNILGHGLDSAIDAFLQQEPKLVEGINAFFRAQINLQQLESYRVNFQNTYALDLTMSCTPKIGQVLKRGFATL